MRNDEEEKGARFARERERLYQGEKMNTTTTTKKKRKHELK